MDKKPYPSFTQGKSPFYSKPFSSKKETPSRQNDTLFSTSGPKKYIPGQQSFKLILSYFEYNNFQDFNTWQQIAKTKTDYKFDETPGQKIDCQLIFKWQANDKENFTFKASAKNKKNAKRKTLVQLVETLMTKGLIGYGFKQKNFIDKLPRRKKYESSSSQEDNNVNETNHTKKATLFNFMKEDSVQAIIESLCLENVIEVWNWALSKKSIGLVSKVLEKVLGRVEEKDQIQEEKSAHNSVQNPVQKQVSYVEQSKDPFEEDLTVFIRYYQLQRTKYQPKSFSLFPIDKERSIQMSLPSVEVSQNAQKGFKIDSFRKFRTIEQVSQFLGKKTLFKTQIKVKSGFFEDLKDFTLPKFEQDIGEEKLLPIKIIEKMFNHVLYISQDYHFALKVLHVLETSIKNIQFFTTAAKKSEGQKISVSEQAFKQKAQTYYKDMKHKLLTEMLYNLKIKMSKQNLNKSIYIEGMLNFASSHSKYDGIFQLTSKQPQEIMSKKLQRKTNLNEFFEHYEFCTDEMVLLVNKINQQKYIGTIQELNQSFKIYVPFLLFQSEHDFPVPFTMHKLLNGKIYNKLSVALIHVCKHYMDYVDYTLGGSKNVTLIYQTPSGPHTQLIEELLAEFIAKKFFVLIVSENYEILSKVLNEKGFKCLKISQNTDEKIVSKNNIILSNQLNVCTDFMKNIAFDRVIIDQAHKIPQIISLLSIIKCTKKIYLIGDPNLPRNEMKSPLSKANNAQKSLFERYIQLKSPYIVFNSSKLKQNSQALNATKQDKIYDSTIIQWLKHSLYGPSLITDLQTTKKKTPLIKGFNWPSNQYRLCFLNTQATAVSRSFQQFINYECFLITWIIAEVLKSGFTSLEQISCCCVDSSLVSILQQHLLKILIKLNIQPLQWPMVFQSLIKSLNGSIWSKNDLIIVLASSGKNNFDFLNQQERKNDDIELGKKLSAALLQAERGLIIVGDIEQLSAKSSAWSNFIDWMASKRLILSYNLPK